MFHIALYQPEIPPNTGNIIRLCANTGSQLHLIHPLGFELTDKHLRRAGLDYREWVGIQEYANYTSFLAQYAGQRRIFLCSTKGKTRYDSVRYAPEDMFLFGPETRGLPDAVLADADAGAVIHIPMVPGNRSLNLSNAAAVIVYEAWRQNNFPGTSHTSAINSLA